MSALPDVEQLREEALEARFRRRLRYVLGGVVFAVLVGVALRAFGRAAGTLASDPQDQNAIILLFAAPFAPMLVLAPLALWRWVDTRAARREITPLLADRQRDPAAAQRRLARLLFNLAVIVPVIGAVFWRRPGTGLLATILVSALVASRWVPHLWLSRLPTARAVSWLEGWPALWILDAERAEFLAARGLAREAARYYLLEFDHAQGSRWASHLLSRLARVVPPERGQRLLVSARRLDPANARVWLYSVQLALQRGEREAWVAALAQLARDWLQDPLSEATLAWALHRCGQEGVSTPLEAAERGAGKLSAHRAAEVWQIVSLVRAGLGEDESAVQANQQATALAGSLSEEARRG